MSQNIRLFAIILSLAILAGCQKDIIENTSTTITGSFESGSIGTTEQTGKNEWEISLSDDNNNSELPASWRSWWYIKMENVSTSVSTQITIKNEGWPYYYIPVYSYDQETWFRFSEEEVTQQETQTPDEIGELTIKKKFEQKEVWIARFYPYTFSDLEKYLTKLKGNSLVDISVPGHSQKGKPIYLLKITDPTISQSGKKRVFMHARTHPAETPPSFVIEGLVNFLIGGSAEANDILSRFEVYIFPMQNVDGVIAGNYRSTPKSENLEMMWYFDSTNPLELTSESPVEVTTIHDCAKKLMNDGGEPITIALNLHASNSEPDIRPFFYPHFGPATNGYSTREASLWNKQLSFIDRFEANYGEEMIEPITGDGGNSFASKTYPESWWWANYKDQVMAMTLEMTYGKAGYSRRIVPDDLRDLGVSLIKSIRDYYDYPLTNYQTMRKRGENIRLRNLKYPELYPPKAKDESKE
ncbi:MAG TPA: M14-type cytosolic carboxypeptidase [Prolixibacteraceae bacterium]|nr:M14-type cytosolic carboxypeptidase [Prolixibacteraceae bacterium]